jgi:hypothetical protein
MLPGLAGLLGAFILILIEVRPSRTVMQIVEQRLEDLRAEDAREMGRWKDETLGSIYRQVIDHVERGVITCRACADAAASAYREGERKLAEVPPPRSSVNHGHVCQCGGPTSVPVTFRLVRHAEFPKKAAS